MYDRYAITAELRRQGHTFTSLARRLGVTRTLVGFVVTGARSNTRVRREIARVLHKRVADLWPNQTQQEKAA